MTINERLKAAIQVLRNHFSEGAQAGGTPPLRPSPEGTSTQRLQAAAMSEGMVGRPEDTGWRKLTGTLGSRELPMMTWEQSIEIAYWLWKTNPLGRWIIEIMTAFVAGDGFTLEADNEDLKKFLNDFWYHPVNDFPTYAEKHTRELGIFGCLVLPKFVTPYGGKMAVGFVDPAQIKMVITDPQNVKMIIGVQTKGANMQDGRKYKTVLPPEAEEFLSPDARAWRDNCQYECFYFAINNVTNDPNGTSDLFEIADWLDAYEQFLYDYADKWPLLNSLVWDMLVEDGDENTIPRQVKAFTKKSGSVFGHNQKVKVTPLAPDLKSVDAEKGASLFRNHILGAKTLPSFWFGGGQDSNLAISQEMSAPTYKMMNKRQLVIKGIFYAICNEAVREADLHGMLRHVPMDQREFSINTPELAAKDITKFAQAINQLTSSLVAAKADNMISQEDAVKTFVFALSMIGYEIDVTAATQALEEEARTRGYEDYTQDPGPEVPAAEDVRAPEADPATVETGQNA